MIQDSKLATFLRALSVLLAVLVFTALLRCAMIESFQGECTFDEGTNLAVAKTYVDIGSYGLPMGAGDSYRERNSKIYPFPWWITTGPTVNWLTGFVARLTGAPLMISGRAVVLGYFLLAVLAGTAIVLRRRGNLLILPLVVAIFSFGVSDRYWSWYVLRIHGEGAAFLFFLLGTFFYSTSVSAKSERLHLYLTGVFWSLAVISKLIILLPIATLVGFEWLLRVVEQRKLGRGIFAGSVPIVLGCLTVSVGWQFYQLISLGFGGYFRLKKELFDYILLMGFSKKSVGTQGWWAHVLELTATWKRVLSEQTELFLLAGAGCVWICVQLARGTRSGEWKTLARSLWTRLLVASVPIQAWFVFLSRDNWERHLAPGKILFTFAGLGVLLELLHRWSNARFALEDRNGRYLAAFAAACAAAFVAHFPADAKGILGEQFRAGMELRQFAEKHDARWISQVDFVFYGPEIHYDTGQAIISIDTENPDLDICRAAPVVPDSVYGILTGKKTTGSSWWRCTPGSVIQSRKYPNFEFEGCWGRDLKCLPNPKKRPS